MESRKNHLSNLLDELPISKIENVFGLGNTLTARRGVSVKIKSVHYDFETYQGLPADNLRFEHNLQPYEPSTTKTTSNSPSQPNVVVHVTLTLESGARYRVTNQYFRHNRAELFGDFTEIKNKLIDVRQNSDGEIYWNDSNRQACEQSSEEGYLCTYAETEVQSKLALLNPAELSPQTTLPTNQEVIAEARYLESSQRALWQLGWGLKFSVCEESALKTDRYGRNTQCLQAETQEAQGSSVGVEELENNRFSFSESATIRAGASDLILGLFEAIIPENLKGPQPLTA